MRTSLALFVSALVAAGSATVNAQVFDVGGFEGYAGGTPPAPVTGQPIQGSITDPVPAPGTPTWINPFPNSPDGLIVTDTTASGHDKVLSISPAGSSAADVAGSYLPFGTDIYAPGKPISIDFDQYRGTTNQDIYILEEPSLRTTSWYGYEYGVGSPNYLYPNSIPAGSTSGHGGLLLIPNKWQHVHMVLDFDAGTVTSSIDGAPPIDFPSGTQPFLANGKHFHGIGFQVIGAPGAGVNYFDNLVVSGGVNPIPEPSSLALLAGALCPLALRRRRRI